MSAQLPAAPLRLFLVRHGETSWSLSGRHTGKSDIPLTDRGRQEVALLAPVLKKQSFSAAFTSPLGRSRQTAALAGFPDATVTYDLSELDYGDYEGLTSADIAKLVPGWTLWTHPCPGGESLQHAADRVLKLIDQAAFTGGNVLMFAHGHILRILAATWLKQPPSAGRLLILEAGSLCILSHEHQVQAIELWNWRADVSMALL